MNRLSNKVFGAMSILIGMCTSSAAMAGAWSSAPALNVPREDFGAAVDHNGDIWVLGGRNRIGGCASGEGPILDSVERLAFDGTSYATNWELTSIVMPTPRYLHAVAISRGHIYLFGGIPEREISQPPPLAEVDRFTIQTGVWDSITVPPLPNPTMLGDALVDPRGRIWYVGGYTLPGPAHVVPDVVIFDPNSPGLGWQPGPSLNEARGQFGLVLGHDCQIYAIGGFGAPLGNHLRSVEMTDALGISPWIQLSESLPEPASNDDKAVVGSDGLIYVIGGYTSSWIDRVLRMDPNTGAWLPAAPVTQARDLHRTVLGHDDHLYVIGGQLPGCNSTTDVEKLDTGPLVIDDCNANGISDDCEPDLDGDGLINDCDDDIDGDGVPNMNDACPEALALCGVEADGCAFGDFNKDGDVDLGDFACFAQNFTGFIR